MEDKSKLKAIAHHLKPVLIVNEITDNIITAFNELLDNHELIKIQINGEKDARDEIALSLSKTAKAGLVQQIGKQAVFIRPNKKANPKLSNLHRFDFITK
jgi:RNA-binding protein